MNRTDFEPFFKAMVKEMKRHEPKKGDSWKDEDFIADYYCRYGDSEPCAPIRQNMDEWLYYLFRKTTTAYKRSKKIDELVDIANISAMIWIRKKGLVKKGKGD
jgi:hypothetical protein